MVRASGEARMVGGKDAGLLRRAVMLSLGSRTTQPIRSASDREAIERYLYRRSARDHALFVFGMRTGRRISDLVKLDVGDVAYIDRRGRLCVKERFEIKEKKTGKRADIIIHPRSRRVLSR